MKPERSVFLIPHCSTCQKYVKAAGKSISGFAMHNIKEQNISAGELDWLAEQVGSYNALFSRNARKYRSMNLKDRTLSEAEIRQLILDEYTFLKRPVIVGETAIEVAGKVYPRHS
jgi:arsenate reductase